MKRSELEALDKADLVALAERQAGRIAELEARLSGMDGRLEELERRTMRGAAPFAREDAKRARSPKRSGRKGRPLHDRRVVPGLQGITALCFGWFSAPWLSVVVLLLILRSEAWVLG